MLTAPWTPGTLADQVRSRLSRRPDSDLLRDLERDDATVADRLVHAIDRALGPRPVLHLAEGTRLTRQDREVNCVFVVRVGSVALDRTSPVGELRLHHTSTGPIVGLLSLAHQRRAYFTARATTPVEVVHLTIDQLDLALELEPAVGAAMAATSVRALAQRLRRSEQLQVEKTQLNRELEQEQRRLSDALTALEAARLELVEQARMATLGELAAGVAHELNNPVSALSRAASYIADDVAALLDDHPAGDLARSSLARQRERPPVSTSEERATRRALADAIGDADLARRLVAAGVTDPEQARQLAEADPTALEVVERAAALGNAVRNLEVAGGRVTELVESLRAYARPDQAPVEGIDVHTTLDDTLRLVAHQLQGVEVTRRYGTLPAVRGHPGQLSQVWTNLLVNAAEAMEGQGRLEIVTDRPDVSHVRVRVIDDGPGIDPELLPQLFEPRFTTKQGQVRYGLGLGLAIARRVVHGHGGEVSVDSEPGRTVATVVLPIAGPPAEPGPRATTTDHEEGGP